MNESNIEAKLTDINKYADYENGGTFLGIVCIKDPVREEVKSAISDCKTAGIRVIMITGDNKNTAEAICKRIGIFEEDEDTTGKAFSGREFDDLSPADQSAACRIAPRRSDDTYSPGCPTPSSPS